MVGARKLLKAMHMKHTTRTATTSRSSSQEDWPSPKYVETEINADSLRCRACLREGNIPIYGNYDYPDLSREFQGVTGIKIQVNDEFPKYMCEDCYTLLQSGIQLQVIAQQSDRVLQPDNYSQDSDNDYDPNDGYSDSVKTNSIKGKKQIKIKQERIKVKQEPNTGNKGATSKKSKQELDKKYVCGRCKRFFDTETEYETHLVSQEHKNVKATCPICKKDFNVLYLRSHMNYHRTDLTYVCDQCGKKFTVKARFDAHRKIHSRELNYKCSKCPYRGRCSTSLKIHMRTHTGDKPYKCPQCPNRSFINWSNLNTHLFTHKAEKKYKCDQCVMSFLFKPELARHVRSQHQGIKDHICNICGKAFGLRGQMMKHQTKVHHRQKNTISKRPLYLLPEYQETCENEDALPT